MAQVPVWADEPTHTSPFSAVNLNALSNAIPPRTATIIVAASNSTPNGKLSADYVSTGSGDETTINTAVAALPATGGRVILLEGTYTCTNPIVINQNYVTLQGQGLGFNTVIAAPSGTVNRTATILVGNTRALTHTVIRDLALNVGGGTSAVKAGTGHGIAIASDNYLIENVIVQYCSGDAFHYGCDLINPTVQTTVTSGSNGLSLPQGTINVASTTGFGASGTLMLRKSSGAVAYIPYTGTTSTTFTGCTANWGGSSGFTLNTGDVVFAGGQLFNGTTYNCLANNYGINGYYIDWNYSSCEWLLARANGSNSGKPGSSTGAQNGFTVYGTMLKFEMCHPYFNAGAGMKIGDASTYTAANIIVNGGEYETNTDSGIVVRENVGPVTITGGARFYGQGLDGAGADVFLSYNSKDVWITDCVFTQSASSSLTKQIYAFQSTRCSITGCYFTYTAAVQNIILDGASGPCSYFTIRNNTMWNQNSGSRAVQLQGAVTYCRIATNMTDAGFQEVTSGTTPDHNTIVGNTLVTGFSPTITTVGTNTRAYENKGFTGSTSPLSSLGGAGSDTLGGALTTFNSSGTTRNTLDDGSGNLTTAGNITVGTAGFGFQVKEGTNAKMGTATLTAGTVTVSNTSVTATSRIFVTCQTPGGTTGFLRVSARTAGTSFTITSSSGTDTSVVAWFMAEPAP